MQPHIAIQKMTFISAHIKQKQKLTITCIGFWNEQVDFTHRNSISHINYSREMHRKITVSSFVIR